MNTKFASAQTMIAEVEKEHLELLEENQSLKKKVKTLEDEKEELIEQITEFENGEIMSFVPKYLDTMRYSDALKKIINALPNIPIDSLEYLGNKYDMKSASADALTLFNG